VDVIGEDLAERVMAIVGGGGLSDGPVRATEPATAHPVNGHAL